MFECSLSFNIVISVHLVRLPLPFSLSLSLSGVVSLSQALCSTDEYSNSLLHLDLSKNPGVLSGEDASVRKHKPRENIATHCIDIPQLLQLDMMSHFLFSELVSLLVSAQLPGPFGSVGHGLLCGLSEYLTAEEDQMFVCNTKKKFISFSLFNPQHRLTVSTLFLMQLFGALLRGCCADLSFLNLSKNSFSHRLVISIRLGFSNWGMGIPRGTCRRSSTKRGIV